MDMHKLLKQFFLIYISGFILFGVLSQSALALKLKYGDKAEISGLVHKEYFYELYEYGESPDKDQIVGVCILKPDKELNISGKNINQLHMINSENSFVCSNLVGHRVSVQGDVDEVETGHHHGDALIFVKKVEVMR